MIRLTADVARFLISWAPLPLLDTAAVLLFLLLDYSSYGYCTFELVVVAPTRPVCCGLLALINELEWLAELLVTRPKPAEFVPPA